MLHRIDALQIVRLKTRGRLILKTFLLSWGGFTLLMTTALIVLQGMSALDKVPGLCMLGLFLSFVVVLVALALIHEQLKKQVVQLFHTVGVHYGFNRDPIRVGLMRTQHGLSWKLHWQPASGGGKHSRQQPHRFMFRIDGLPADLTIQPADGSSGLDRVPGTDGFLRTTADPAALAERLSPEGLERLYHLIVEQNWQVSSGTLLGVVEPTLWDEYEVETLLMQGKELAALLHPAAPV